MAKSEFENSLEDFYTETIFNHVMFGWMLGYLSSNEGSTQIQAAHKFCDHFGLDIDPFVLPITFNRLQKKYVRSQKNKDDKSH